MPRVWCPQKRPAFAMVPQALAPDLNRASASGFKYFKIMGQRACRYRRCGTWWAAFNRDFRDTCSAPMPGWIERLPVAIAGGLLARVCSLAARAP